MRQSQLFTKTRKEGPKDEVSKNAELLIRAGFIHKEMAGVYALLPMGLRVIKKIEGIIREEMNLIGGQEIEMTTLQGSEIWKRADKWDDEKVDVWFKTQLKNKTELGLAFSHEEAIAEMLKNHITSYKDLPLFVYQFQTKFRNELRSKSGIMRGREFYMKDMYSFSTDKEQMEEMYDKAKDAYLRIFERVGIGETTFVTKADGSVFGDRSDEFQTLCGAGEDTIYLDEEKKIAINKEIYTEERVKEFGLENVVEKKSIEVGNIFPIESIISDKMDFTFTDEEGKQKPVYMGSYGIGIGRVMGTVVEALSDENGIIWPESISPFDVHLILATPDDTSAREYADGLYEKLKGFEVLYDDRDKRAGEKFSDSDLIGIPYRLVVGKSKVIELKDRRTGEVREISEEEAVGGKYLNDYEGK